MEDKNSGSGKFYFHTYMYLQEFVKIKNARCL